MNMRRAKVLGWASVIVGLALVTACRPARGPQAGPAPSLMADLARSYQGQARILPGLGEKAKISWSRGAALAKGACDVAVLITSVRLDKGVARFTLEPIGLPRIETRTAPKCDKPPREYALSISGLDARGSLADLSAVIDRLLVTPETYLAERGVTFSLRPAAKPGPIADKRLKAKSEERTLARDVTRPEQLLLSVAPIRRDDRKEVRYQGEVSFEAVVGVDGRLHDPSLEGSLGPHAERILKALELWRYEPARKGDTPVGLRLDQRTTFRVY